jgi:hypothetical protein
MDALVDGDFVGSDILDTLLQHVAGVTVAQDRTSDRIDLVERYSHFSQAARMRSRSAWLIDSPTPLTVTSVAKCLIFCRRRDRLTVIERLSLCFKMDRP